MFLGRKRFLEAYLTSVESAKTSRAQGEHGSSLRRGRCEHTGTAFLELRLGATMWQKAVGAKAFFMGLQTEADNRKASLGLVVVSFSCEYDTNLESCGKRKSQLSVFPQQAGLGPCVRDIFLIAN